MEIDDEALGLLIWAAYRLPVCVLEGHIIFVRQRGLAPHHFQRDLFLGAELDYFRSRCPRVIDCRHRVDRQIPLVFLRFQEPHPWPASARIIFRAAVPTDRNMDGQTVAFHPALLPAIVGVGWADVARSRVTKNVLRGESSNR